MVRFAAPRDRNRASAVVLIAENKLTGTPCVETRRHAVAQRLGRASRQPEVRRPGRPRACWRMQDTTRRLVFSASLVPELTLRTERLQALRMASTCGMLSRVLLRSHRRPSFSECGGFHEPGKFEAPTGKSEHASLEA